SISELCMLLGKERIELIEVLGLLTLSAGTGHLMFASVGRQSGHVEQAARIVQQPQSIVPTIEAQQVFEGRGRFRLTQQLKLVQLLEGFDLVGVVSDAIQSSPKLAFCDFAGGSARFASV